MRAAGACLECSLLKLPRAGWVSYAHIPARSMEAWVTERIARIQKASRPEANLARTAALEHFTAILASAFLESPEILDKLFPPSRHYGHEQAWHDGNGHSHLQASSLGPDLTVPIRGGSLVLGTWQQIFHLECDVKPRQRSIVVTVMGE